MFNSKIKSNNVSQFFDQLSKLEVNEDKKTSQVIYVRSNKVWVKERSNSLISKIRHFVRTRILWCSTDTKKLADLSSRVKTYLATDTTKADKLITEKCMLDCLEKINKYKNTLEGVKLSHLETVFKNILYAECRDPANRFFIEMKNDPHRSQNISQHIKSFFTDKCLLSKTQIIINRDFSSPNHNVSFKTEQEMNIPKQFFNDVKRSKTTSYNGENFVISSDIITKKEDQTINLVEKMIEDIGIDRFQKITTFVHQSIFADNETDFHMKFLLPKFKFDESLYPGNYFSYAKPPKIGEDIEIVVDKANEKINISVKLVKSLNWQEVSLGYNVHYRAFSIPFADLDQIPNLHSVSEEILETEIKNIDLSSILPSLKVHEQITPFHDSIEEAFAQLDKQLAEANIQL